MKLGNIDLEQADARNVGAICWNLFYKKHGPEFAGAYLDAAESGDLHTTVCKLVWSALEWTEDKIKDRAIADENFYRDFSYRDCAKRTGHGSNYMGLVSVSRATKIPMGQLVDFQEKYFKAFPCIEMWQQWVVEQLRDQGYITSLMGRRRYFFGRYKDENVVREAVAYEPQSVTGDVINTGLLNLWRGHRVQLLAQIHDSILFQFPTEEENEIIPWAMEQLTIPIQLQHDRLFTIPVEAKTGWNWGEQKNIKTRKLDNLDGLRKFDGADDRIAPVRKNKKLSFADMVR